MVQMCLYILPLTNSLSTHLWFTDWEPWILLHLNDLASTSILNGFCSDYKHHLLSQTSAGDDATGKLI